jgi:uncharacterized membrane protein
MRTSTGYLMGVAVGAAITFLFDPRSGRRRRAVLRDRLTGFTSDLDDAARVAARDLAHRSRGLKARVERMFSSDDGRPSDDVLVERVRASLGRAVSHPGAIEVSAHEGNVTLTGAVLASEHAQLLRCVANVRGVEGIRDQLAVHESAAGISELQGGRPRQPARFELMQRNWSPAARAVTGVVGGAMTLRGLLDRGPLGLVVAGTGAALLARSATNAPLKELVKGEHPILIRKTIHVNAPLEDVFQTFLEHENFPLFMKNVRDVRRSEDGTEHWNVAGPAGSTIEWDSQTTVREPYREIAWRTLPHSRVQHEGTIRFAPHGDSGTRLEIEMHYVPPGGLIGHTIAKMFGTDPKTELDEDLVRLKTFLETGKTPRDAAKHAPIVRPAERQPSQEQPLM